MNLHVVIVTSHGLVNSIWFPAVSYTFQTLPVLNGAEWCAEWWNSAMKSKIIFSPPTKWLLHVHVHVNIYQKLMLQYLSSKHNFHINNCHELKELLLNWLTFSLFLKDWFYSIPLRDTFFIIYTALQQLGCGSLFRTISEGLQNEIIILISKVDLKGFCHELKENF